MLRHHIYTLLFLFFVGMIFSSCEEEYVFDTDDFESKLVVNSLFSSDEPWDVQVTSSYNILEKSSAPIVSNARVEIYNDDNEFLYELFHDAEGHYRNNEIKPSPTRGYNIKVSAPGFKSVYAHSNVPEKSKLTINEFSANEGQSVEVDFVIEDNSNLETYFIYEVVQVVENEDGYTTKKPLSISWLNDLRNNPSNLIDNDREIIDSGLFGDGKYTTIYKSRDFSGRKALPNNSTFANVNPYDSSPITVQGKINPYTNTDTWVDEFNDFSEDDTSVETTSNKSFPKYELRVMSISKELYNYYYSVEQFLEHSDPNSLQDPAEVYTNINNGLGIFAGYSESFIQF